MCWRLLAAALLLAPGCLTGSMRRDSRFEPLPRGSLRALQIGASDLGDVLSSLGAPLWVWETAGDGMATAYGWHKERGWSLTLSVPVTQQLNATLSYDDLDADLTGVVLFFDAERELVALRRGRLRDLVLEGVRIRSSLVEDEDEEGSSPPS